MAHVYKLVGSRVGDIQETSNKLFYRWLTLVFIIEAHVYFFIEALHVINSYWLLDSLLGYLVRDCLDLEQ